MSTRGKENIMNKEEIKKIVDNIKDAVSKSGDSRVIITNKKGEVVLNIPFIAGAAGVAVSLFAAKWALIASVVATIGFGCGVEVVKADGQVIKIK